ncbi:hypothetical protein MUK70_14700 [Dyadobacter chenwenxiniae]|uniref:Uncharacterized protein n=1 Tax=Dyadobacter chenwenxiniae TaxID=2906456 RepID=A0A9X1TC31_9BACT|nr:hypothetical protein [Dyadobacter chenwenxiniae]MCF0060491.1 hypothetical protein [Dyadobacter chenwenxiniae]UON86223.1 hypothetical protein MUK70_14700 [Dyadobacter chenwenxiniae]
MMITISLATILLLTVFVLFIGYNVVLRMFPAVRYKSYDPIERCEEYMYQGSYNKVFAGSGLIGELDHYMPEGAFSLCFPYSGSCTGLEIIALSGKVPEVVFVETNYISKGSDKELITTVFEKQWRKLRHVAPCFLKKNRPDSLIKSAVKHLSISKRPETANPDFGRLNTEELDRFYRIYNESIDTHHFENILEELEKHVNYISAQGCQIVFFEMPVHKDLYHSKLLEYQRNTLKAVFNNQNYHWIESGQLHDYQTIDGIHLTKESMYRYAHFLIQNKRTLLT